MGGRRRLIALGIAALTLLSPAPVSAHAVLLASYPADGSVLAAVPAAVHLWFSEPVQLVENSIVVIGPAGRRVERGPIQSDGLELSVPLHASARGTYVVIWRVISLDTHPAAGRFAFSVGRASNVLGVGGSYAGAGLALQVAARWLHSTGYALGFGALAWLLLVLQPAARGDDRGAERRLWRLVTVGILLLVLAEPLALLGQTASLSTGTLFDPGVAGAALASSFGRVLAQRLAVAILLWVLLAALRDGARRAGWAAMILALALALIDGEASHAANTRPEWLGLGINAVHVAAAGVWAGGLAALLAVWGVIEPPRRACLVRRFGWAAAVSLALLGLTGLAMAWLHLGGPAGLTTSAYGRALAAKTLAVLVALLLALAGARVRRARREQWWTLEAVALLGVLLLAGLVVSLPPPA